MSDWAGFSDVELRRLQQKDSAPSRGRKPAPSTRSRQQLQRERALQLAVSPGLPPGQQLSKPPPKDEHRPAAPVVAAPVVAAPVVAAPVAAVPVVAAPVVKPEVKQKCSEEKPAAEELSPVVKELEKREVELREKTRLEQLQQEQKTMEERNKRKKALLTKTIAEKSRQTQAEAVKLKRIQKELQALDDMVSNDIGILRGRIEQASWDYSAARKRYEKAEAEYVTAKLDLHKKTEVKEQLTEHLCAIIQQNELRKAHKLEELMQQLQMQATEEEEQELERQKEEEEQKSQRNGLLETQGDGKEPNGILDNQGEKVQSTRDCRSTEEGGSEQGGEGAGEGAGGAVQQDQNLTVQPPNTEQHCQTLENCPQNETTSS